MKEVMKMCKVKHCFTSSYHPQTNGLTERLNRTLINMISTYVNTVQKNWDEILPFITHVYNTTIQETTGYSPFFLLFGREPMSLLDDENIPMDIWIPVRKIGKCEKLLRKYFGLYRILKKVSNVNYLIEPKDNPGLDPLIVHVSRLKPYFERIDEPDPLILSYIAGHLRPLVYKEEAKSFPMCTRCKTEEATPQHILNCIGKDKGSLYREPRRVLELLYEHDLQDLV
ncbi:K02A2.6-like [Cordylochernes scorpioides]|uniref:K02A2.6-like n=1 Tax=Cordylochernes scorpioides TaxID=51811 RepID=A0ABY6KWP0_9ARAC|nr:K02A2.6-like [Cordylochernes scorpioides]